MPTRSGMGAAVWAVLSLLVAEGGAQGAVKLEADAKVFFLGNGIPADNAYDNQTTTDPLVLSLTGGPVSKTSSRDNNSATASAVITTSVGEIHAVLSAAGSTTGASVQGHAEVHGEWDDSVRATSSDPLLNLKTIHATIRMEIDHTVTSSGTTWRVESYSPWTGSYADSSASPNALNYVTGTVDFTVNGSAITLWQNFNAWIDATVLSAGSASGTLDIGHTVHFYLSGPAGVTFSGSNGETFQPAAADVPEPASLALFGLGLAGIVAGTRRRTPGNEGSSR